MIVKVLNQKGDEVGETRLPKEIFEVKMNFIYETSYNKNLD